MFEFQVCFLPYKSSRKNSSNYFQRIKIDTLKVRNEILEFKPLICFVWSWLLVWTEKTYLITSLKRARKNIKSNLMHASSFDKNHSGFSEFYI